jgi:topoisomerase-4 subunit A
MELRREKDALEKERDELHALLADPKKQKNRLKRDLRQLRKEYGEDTPLGRRRTTVAEAAPTAVFSMDAMIEREPVTIILSQKGWVRGARGHVELGPDGTGEGFKYKDGDAPAFALHAQTTDKLLLATDTGRFFTLRCDKLPGARGFGEPVRAMLDIEPDAHIVAAVLYRPDAELLLASSNGRGFAVKMADLLAETRKGRQVVNVKDGRLVIVRPMAPEHDHIAVSGDNRKLVVFNREELPIMERGQGVQLQRYKDGGLADAVSFKLEDGLSWKMGGKGDRTRTETEMWQWKVARGGTGRMPPQGFPRDNRFG